MADLSHVLDPETGFGCDGGYSEPYCLYVDSRLTKEAQRIVLTHEAIEEFTTRNEIKIKHGDINRLGAAILDALGQLEEYHHGNET